MVIFLQLCLFCVAVAIRGQFLFGKHLRPSDTPNRLNYIYQNNRYTILGRHVGIRQQNGIAFIITPEQWYHRILKKIGIAHEIKIANAEFDKKYFITTDYPTHLEQMLASGQLLTHLQELFFLPVKSLYATSHKIWCVISITDLHKTEDHYTKHFKLLENISKSSQKSAGHEYGQVQSRKLGLAAFLFICVHAGLLTLGILGMLPTVADFIETVDIFAWILKGAIGGIIAATVWFFLIVNIFRKSSWVCWVFADFLLCGIMGFILSGIIITREANIHLSQPPAHVFRQPILQKICELKCKENCGRRCTRESSYTFESDAICNPESRAKIMQQKRQTDYICLSSAWYEYTMRVQHWRKPSSYSFSSDVTLFDQVQVGSYLNVPVNEGAFGIEWVRTNHIQP